MILGIVLVVVVIGGVILATGNQSTTPVPVEENNVPSQEPAMKKEGASIEIKDFKFSPSTLTVKAGEKITFTNRDLPGHSITSDEQGLFDSGVLGKDQSGTITAPTKPGTYAFHCTPHPSITGTLVVE